MPTSVVIVEFLASFSFIVGSRFVIKLIYLESLKSSDDFENIVIYGAGVSGLITKKTVQNDTRNNQKVICFIDDNSKLWDTRIEGIKVHGPHELKKLYEKHNIDTVIIAIQNPKAERRKLFWMNVLNSKSRFKKFLIPKAGSMVSLAQSNLSKPKLKIY